LDLGATRGLVGLGSEGGQLGDLPFGHVAWLPQFRIVPALKQSRSRVIPEQVGIAHVCLQHINRLVARHIAHLEQAPRREALVRNPERSE
jgi:hypothetical protein